MTLLGAKNIFHTAPIIEALGIECSQVTENHCTASLVLKPLHFQHLGIVHGGVVTILAGHAATASVTSLLEEDQFVVANHFICNLSSPAKEGILQADARVVDRLAKGATTEVIVTNVVNDQRVEIGRFKFNFVIKRDREHTSGSDSR